MKTYALLHFYVNVIEHIIAWLHVYMQNAVIWLAGFWNLDHLYISV